jgi:hypothetical protein
MRTSSIVFWFPVLLGLLACSPATSVRIGPKVPERPANCEMEVLKRGETPTRPYRDVGLVELENCQDYDQLPCLKWLVEAACGLGGHVAYLPDNGGGPVLDTAPIMPYEGGQLATGTVTYRVLVAAYAAALNHDLENDPVYKSRTCQPACAAGEVCSDGACRRAEDCDDAVKEAAKVKDPDAFSTGRCTE